MKSRDPFLRVSVSKAAGLDTLNIAKNGLLKLLYFNDFLFVVYAGKKHRIKVRKMPEI